MSESMIILVSIWVAVGIAAVSWMVKALEARHIARENAAVEAEHEAAFVELIDGLRDDLRDYDVAVAIAHADNSQARLIEGLRQQMGY